MTGRWRSGPDGEIVEWEDNPGYRPSPRALGWPEPADEVDRAVQLASTGYGPGEAVPAALVGREVAVLTAPGGEGLVSAAAPDGTPVVPVFTSSVFLRTAGRFAFELVGVDDLVTRVPEGHVLYLNPSAAVGMLLDPGPVRDAVRNGAGSGPSRPPPQSGARRRWSPRPFTRSGDGRVSRWSSVLRGRGRRGTAVPADGGNGAGNRDAGGPRWRTSTVCCWCARSRTTPSRWTSSPRWRAPSGGRRTSSR